jgi:hypothetical protein
VLAKVLEVVAGAAQTVVLLGTFLLGLGWGGWTHGTALLLAVAAFVPLLVCARRRQLLLVLLVPVLSAAASAGLLRLGHSLGHTGT